MGMRIEPDSHVPVYLQIVAQIRSAIAAGVYRPGESLPSLRALATRAGTGKSEPGPLPRDAKQIARELHLALRNADLAPPANLSRSSRATRGRVRRLRRTTRWN